MKVGFLGPNGSFSHIAAFSLYPNDEIIAFSTIPDSIDAVNEGRVDKTVVPLENTIEGSVNITLDYILRYHRLSIVKEVTVPIDQHLLVAGGYKATWKKDINKIFSHPHAIAQCHLFIRKTFPNMEIEYTDSTASAAKYVSQHPHEAVAAIANARAADIYNLNVAQPYINDYTNNHTRFVVLDRENTVDKGATNEGAFKSDKTTILVTLPDDHSGALHQVLSAFAWRKLNLSKIESRPMKTGLGNYFFIIDVDKKQDDVLIPGAIQEIKALGCGVTVLGSYPCYQLNDDQLHKNDQATS
ncbi:prephenate dehydratase [Alteribacter populi]|uniref:prephenate dehydratase n=1 Tax=Alteribacter populi TaxID=2011011 RepID=UPI000BBA6EB9|nr:prephenate dehydratase [Alteribacter populi]